MKPRIPTEDPIKIFWMRLVRVTGSSYAVSCPFCIDGTFRLKRDEENRLSRSDQCQKCNQKVRWADKAILGEKLY